MLIRSLAVSLLSLSFIGCSAPETHSQEHSDSAIYGPAYSKVLASLTTVEKSYQKLVKVIKYGTSLEGRDLTVVKLDLRPETTGERPAVLITGATHGDEYLNIVDRMPAWFAENHTRQPGVSQYLEKGGVIYIVPIFNPDGYENRTRENSKGHDLNRDFDVLPLRSIKFSQSETKSLTRFLDQEIRENNLDLRITMDYHCCQGSLVYPWGYTKSSLPADALERHIAVADSMKKYISPRYVSGATYELLGYLSQGSSKDYYYARYGALAFTFEGIIRDEAKNFERHTSWWNALLGGIARE